MTRHRGVIVATCVFLPALAAGVITVNDYIGKNPNPGLAKTHQPALLTKQETITYRLVLANYYVKPRAIPNWQLP
ncbi:MAG: hypothetical protein U0526_03530 [Candidatus Saccharibacteria bacterium]